MIDCDIRQPHSLSSFKSFQILALKFISQLLRCVSISHVCYNCLLYITGFVTEGQDLFYRTLKTDFPIINYEWTVDKRLDEYIFYWGVKQSHI